MRLARVAQLLCAAVVLAALLHAGASVRQHLLDPFDLGHESAQLDSVRVLQSGRSLYDPEVYSSAPYVLTMYTPLYFELLARLPASESLPLLTGRLLSVACTLITCAALFWAARGRTARGLAALGGPAFLLVEPVRDQIAYLRLDSLGLALSVWAVVVVQRSRTGASTVVAALLCFLAVATKQTHLAAGVAILVHLWRADRPRARSFGALWAGLLLVGAAAATLAWGRGFWFSTTIAPANPYAPGQYVAWGRIMLQQPPFALLALLTAWTLGRALRREGLGLFRHSVFATYVSVSWLVLLLTLGKLGSTRFYFFEPLMAQLLWLVSELAPDVVGRLTRAGTAAAVALLVLVATNAMLSEQVYRDPLNNWEPASLATDAGVDRYPEVRAELARRGIHDARVLRLGPPRHTFGARDVVCLNDLYLYHLVWKAGRLDSAPLCADIARDAFDLILVENRLPVPPPDRARQPLGDVLLAVQAHYRRLARDGFYQYFVRDG